LSARSVRPTILALAAATLAALGPAARADLFVAGTISEVAPGGTVTAFVSGFSHPMGLAFDASGNLFVADNRLGTISEVAPGGTVTPFASGFSQPYFMVFSPTATVPEPSTLALVGLASAGFAASRWRAWRRSAPPCQGA
jgi:hypothetical protein